MIPQRALIRRNEEILKKIEEGATIKSLKKEYRMSEWAFYKIRGRYRLRDMAPRFAAPLKIGFGTPEKNTLPSKTSSEISGLSNSVQKNNLTVF